MRLLIQRVLRAEVFVANESKGSIGRGALLFLGIHREDTSLQVEWLVEKFVHLRLFAGSDGKMDRSILDEQAEVLVVSQFTLYGECGKGRRPDFFSAAPPVVASPLYELFLSKLRLYPIKVESGVFKAHMEVSLINDGPVTLLVDTKS